MYCRHPERCVWLWSRASLLAPPHPSSHLLPISSVWPESKQQWDANARSDSLLMYPNKSHPGQTALELVLTELGERSREK